MVECSEHPETCENKKFSSCSAFACTDTYAEIAAASGRDVDDVLDIHAGAISYGLQTVVEQGISITSTLLEGQGRVLSEAVSASALASRPHIRARGPRHRSRHSGLIRDWNSERD